MIWSGSFKRWRRNLLTVLALSISFMLVLSLSSLARGMDKAAKGASGSTPRDLVISSGGFVPSVEDAHSKSMELLSDHRNITAAMPVLTLVGRLAFPLHEERTVLRSVPPTPHGLYEGDYRSESSGMVGLVPGLTRSFLRDGALVIRSERLVMDGFFDEEGSPFRDSNYTFGWTGELLLDENVARSYSLTIGDPVLYITPNGTVLDAFRLKGLLRTSLLGGGLSSRLLGGIAIVHLGELQYLEGYGPEEKSGSGRRDLCSAIYLDLADDISSGASLEAFRSELRSSFPGHSIVTSEGRIYRLDEEVLVLTVFSIGVATTALVIGALFLSSIMMLDVEDRSREISIKRAIGISGSRVYLEVLRDSLLLAFFAAVLGSVLGGYLLGLLDDQMRTLYGLDLEFFVLNGSRVALTALSMLVFVALFSVAPGLRAAALGPGKGPNGVKDR